jgi:hypothetical protein
MDGERVVLVLVFLPVISQRRTNEEQCKCGYDDAYHCGSPCEQSRVPQRLALDRAAFNVSEGHDTVIQSWHESCFPAPEYWDRHVF